MSTSNMNFRQRLVRYLIGFGVGMILVNVFFGERGCGTWFPGNQVKKRIIEKNPQKIVASKTTCQIKCQDLQFEDIDIALGEEGEVLFSESSVDEYPYLYVIQGERDDVRFKFGFTYKKDSSTVVSFAQRLDKTFECDCK